MKMINIFKCLIATVLFLIGLMIVSYVDSTRLLVATVTKINGSIVILTDKCGDQWEWKMKKNEYFIKNEQVTMILNMNCTPHTWQDDEIVKIKHNK